MKDYQNHPAFIDAKTATREELIDWLAKWFIAQAYPNTLMHNYLAMRTTQQLRKNYKEIQKALIELENEK